MTATRCTPRLPRRPPARRPVHTPVLRATEIRRSWYRPVSASQCDLLSATTESRPYDRRLSHVVVVD